MEKRFDKPPISCKMIVDKIRENSYAKEETLKMDFAMLFIATMIASTKNGNAMYSMLGWFCLSKEFKDHDWCQMIVGTIRVCKSDWDKNDRDSFFRGPLTVLVLLYLDNTTCPGLGGDREQAPISFWIKEMMNMRKDLEVRNGGFGLGDVWDLYDDDQEYDQLSEDEVVDLLKGEDEKVSEGFDRMSLEDCIDGLFGMLDEASGLNRKLEEVVALVAARFPNSGCLLPVLERYKLIFNKSVVNDKGEPFGEKSDVVQAKGKTDVVEDVFSGAYDTQRMDDKPSFDLGLSQPLLTTQELVAMQEENVKIVEPKADVGGKGKRKKQMSKYGKSPFMLRAVDIKTWMQSKDKVIWRYLASCVEDTQTHVFLTESGIGLMYFQLKDFYPSVWMGDTVINCFATVLNHEENDDILTNTQYNDTGRLEKFSSALLMALNKGESLLNLAGYTVIVFPILENNHFYLVSFDMENLAISVIDNMHASESFIKVFDDDDFLKKSTPFKVIEWATIGNSVDCGVFAMRHMETWFSETNIKWDSGFPLAYTQKKASLTRLRKKYACKIICSDANKLRNEVMGATIAWNIAEGY
ncbi:putative Ulp1 protease family catalytic domain, papain-like cysteine peptidase superfamily [Helianthus anomalus]